MDAKFSLGNIGITDYLIVRCRLVSSPGADAAPRQAFGPLPPTNQNVVFTGLNPDFYFFDVYESVDGTALTSLFNTFEINVASNQILSENRYYVVDRNTVSPIDGSVIDPVDGSTVLNDPYLNGKTITAVTQRAFGPLIPTDEWTRTGTGIALVPPLSFAHFDTYIISIAYPASASPVASAGPFQTEIDITANTSLDNTYYNKTINCNGAGSRLVITLDYVATVPDGTQFLFTDQEGGSQYQAKIISRAGEVIKWRGINMSEIWIGKGEWLILKKRGSYWKVVQTHEGLNMVGLITSCTWKLHPNTLTENGGLADADDFPRIWWFITTRLTSDSAYLDDNLDNVGYTRPANRNGQFIYSITKRKFRMPDTQRLTQKGLKNFDTYGTDTPFRPVDYPGGFQAGQVGEINGAMTVLAASTSQTQTGTGKMTSGSDTPEPGNASINVQINMGKPNQVDNNGVIFARHI